MLPPGMVFMYLSSNLKKNFFSFKKRYSVTNMGLMGHKKRFLWASFLVRVYLRVSCGCVEFRIFRVLSYFVRWVGLFFFWLGRV